MYVATASKQISQLLCRFLINLIKYVPLHIILFVFTILIHNIQTLIADIYAKFSHVYWEDVPSYLFFEPQSITLIAQVHIFQL